MSTGRRIALSFVLGLPVLAFLLHHYFVHGAGLIPTGFTNSENVLYTSYAHQYLDNPGMHLGYSNPFDGDPASPAIYFQPHTLLLAVGMQAGIDPGLLFSLFGFLMALACIYIGIRLLEHLLPDTPNRLVYIVLFTWGGGLTAITGVLSTILSGHLPDNLLDSIYPADPANGWWGLNWGRNFFIPLEAYYHFLFLSGIYCIIRQKWRWAILVGMLVAVSHPFTGIEYLLIVTGWLGLEKIIIRNRNIPWWVLAVHLLLTGLHAWYYLGYLPGFAAHRQLFSQYSAGWTYSFRVFIPAYLLVLLLALLSLRFGKAGWFNSASQRLFFCWALVAFLLSKHEWFIRPMQPIHFTRGYPWAGLFLLGLPALVLIREAARRSQVKKIMFSLFCCLLLLDNTLWITNKLLDRSATESEGHITRDTKEILDWLAKNGNRNDLLLGNSSLVNYLANTYTAVNSWESHPYNTPMIEERRKQELEFLQSGERPGNWNGRRIILLVDTQAAAPAINPQLTTKIIFANSRYQLFIP